LKKLSVPAFAQEAKCKSSAAHSYHNQYYISARSQWHG